MAKKKGNAGSQETSCSEGQIAREREGPEESGGVVTRRPLRQCVDAEAVREADEKIGRRGADLVHQPRKPLQIEAPEVDEPAPRNRRSSPQAGSAEGRRDAQGRDRAAGEHQRGDGISPDGLTPTGRSQSK